MKKITKAGIGLVAVAAVAATGAFVAFGETNQQELHWNDNNTEAVFNSYVDNPYYGREHDFVRVSEAKDKRTLNDPFYGDGMTVTDGGKYTVRLYVHNDAKSVGDNEAGKEATGVKAVSYINLDDSLERYNDGYSTTQSVMGKIYADGGAGIDRTTGKRMENVRDHATFTSENGKGFKLEFVPGSVRYWTCEESTREDITNDCTSIHEWVVSDDIINTPQLLGYYDDGSHTLNGVIPGCVGYAGYLTYDVKAVYEEDEKKPGLEVEKTVAIIDKETGKTGDYFKDGILNCNRSDLKSCEKLTIKAGDDLRFKFIIKNTGEKDLLININDNLEGLEDFTYIPGSTTYKAGADARVKWADADGLITDKDHGITPGIILAPGAGMDFTFDVHVNDNAQKDCEDYLLNNIVHVNGVNPDKQNEIEITTTDDVTVVIPSDKVCTQGYHLDKMARIHDNDKWAHRVNAKGGDTVTYRIRFWNDGNTDLEDVTIDDSEFPADIKYIAGSTSMEYIVCDSNIASEDNLCNGVEGTSKKLDDGVTSGAIKIGKVEAGKTIAVYFKGTIDAALNDKCEDTPLPNKVIGKHAGDQAGQYDTATVYIDAPECHEDVKNFTLRKEVQKDGESEWHESVRVNAGETVRYQIVLKNTGNTTIENIVVTDELVKDLKYIDGTLEVQGVSNYEGHDLKEGIKFPSVPAGTEIYIRFKTTVTGESHEDECEGSETPIPNVAKATADGETKEDDAQVIPNGKTCDLPHTGATNILTATFGAASLATATAYYVISRKKLN